MATTNLNALFVPFLELTLAQTNSQGAYLYRADGDLLAWSGRAPLHSFGAAAEIPLLDGGDTVGRLHVYRQSPAPFADREAAFLRDLSLALGSLLANATARVKLETEVEELSRKLADRKLLERAKGILQAKQQWTEEEAYLFLRRTSRQRRTPMREIARLVVDQSMRSAQ